MISAQRHIPIALLPLLLALPHMASAQESLAWKARAEQHLSTIRTLATTTQFGGISVKIPGEFRDWLPVNEAAQAMAYDEQPEGRRAGNRPNVPAGQIPLFIQFTRLKISGLKVEDDAAPREWAPDANTPAALAGLAPHWLLSHTVGISEFRTDFTVRLGNDKGLFRDPRFDCEVQIEGASIPIEIHALEKTCLTSNPSSRREAFKPGRVTLETKNLPGALQTWMNESFMQQAGEPIVTMLPNALFGLPTLDAVIQKADNEAAGSAEPRPAGLKAKRPRSFNRRPRP